MDAITAAAETILLGCCEDLRAVVAGSDAEALGWTPAPETSPIAVLVRHGATSVRYLLGAAATGRANRERYMAGERAAAFGEQSAEAGELLGLLDGLETDVRRLLAEVPVDRLAEPVAFEGAFEGTPPTRAWMLLHAVDHLREHVGHAQLTQQMYTSLRS